MRIFILGAAILDACSLSNAQASIRQVDFKNFTYPLSGPLLGHSELKWPGQPGDEHSKKKTINLRNGEDPTKASSFKTDGLEHSHFEGFTLQSVSFADVAGDGNKEAIVELLYQTGGTQNTNYVCIYSFTGGKLKLMAYCHTGDRAYSGLYKVYGDHGELVFELLDPRKSLGDCCSAGFVRNRFKWDGKQFVRTGNPEYGKVEPTGIPDK